MPTKKPERKKPAKAVLLTNGPLHSRAQGEPAFVFHGPWAVDFIRMPKFGRAPQPKGLFLLTNSSAAQQVACGVEREVVLNDGVTAFSVSADEPR